MIRSRSVIKYFANVDALLFIAFFLRKLKNLNGFSVVMGMPVLFS